MKVSNGDNIYGPDATTIATPMKTSLSKTSSTYPRFGFFYYFYYFLIENMRERAGYNNVKRTVGKECPKNCNFL